MNANWQHVELDEASAAKVVERLPIIPEAFARLSLPHRSDLIRTQLLIENGGVWFDPTVFVTQSFDNWLPKMMDGGVFLFSRPGRDRLISNWFIAAEPGHQLLIRVRDTLCDYWQNNRFRNHGRGANSIERQVHRLIDRNLVLPMLWLSWPFRRILRVYPYMIYHYVFNYVVRNDSQLAATFARMPEISASGPHQLQRFGIENPYDSNAAAILKDSEIPLHKLRWGVPPGADRPGTVYRHLMASAFS